MTHSGLSIVIPTLNAAASLPATLAPLRHWDGPLDIVIADGDSTDGTADTARAYGASVLTAPRGRGSQISAGLAQAQQPWIMVLHADTQLNADWPKAVKTLMAMPTPAAGYFTFRLDDDSPAARRLERQVAWRCRTFALPYGDQGLVIARPHLEAVGGYVDHPLMEDVDIVRRIVRHGGRAALLPLNCDAVTSAVRFQTTGYLKRSIRNVVCLSLYALGVPPRLIKRIYA